MRFLELIFYKAYAELRVETAKGHLGILWWVLEPVLYMATFYVVFTVIRSGGTDDFVAFLLVGLVAWKWFAATVAMGASSIVNGASLLRQVYIPKYFFSAVVVMTNTFKFLIVFLLLLVFLVLYGVPISWAWLCLPVLILVQLLVIAAMASFLSALLPFFQDLKTLIDNGLMLLFFLSGVIFDISRAPEALKPYLYLNPMVGLVEAYRDVLLQGLMPNWSVLSMLAAAAVIVLMLSQYLLVRYDRVYAKVLIR